VSVREWLYNRATAMHKERGAGTRLPSGTLSPKTRARSPLGPMYELAKRQTWNTPRETPVEYVTDLGHSPQHWQWTRTSSVSGSTTEQQRVYPCGEAPTDGMWGPTQPRKKANRVPAIVRRSWLQSQSVPAFVPNVWGWFPQ
jgi:hypothetical protein